MATTFVGLALPGSGISRAPGAATRALGHHLAALVPLVDVRILGRDELPVGPEDAGRLLVPAVRRLGAPKGPAARIARGPAERLQVGIPRVVVARVKLDSMAVGVAKVDEERVRDPVAAGASLDRTCRPRSGELIAGAQHSGRFANPEGRVVEAWATTDGESY